MDSLQQANVRPELKCPYCNEPHTCCAVCKMIFTGNTQAVSLEGCGHTKHEHCIGECRFCNDTSREEERRNALVENIRTHIAEDGLRRAENRHAIIRNEANVDLISSYSFYTALTLFSIELYEMISNVGDEGTLNDYHANMSMISIASGAALTFIANSIARRGGGGGRKRKNVTRKRRK